MSEFDVHEALKRLQASFEALADTRQRLLDELERSAIVASHRMAGMADMLERPEIDYELEQTSSSEDGVPLLAQTG